MYPILGRYGPFFLYSYTVVIGVGLAAGIGLSAWFIKKKEDGQHPAPYPGWLDGLLVSLLVALVGGRIGFVWANWDYFREVPEEMALVWQGGLSYHGAIVSGLLTLWLWSWWQRRRSRAGDSSNGDSSNSVSFTSYAALLAPGFVLAHLFGWAACWLAGCAFGRETTIGWLTADLPDSFGVFAVRYQSQLLGLGLTAVVFVLALVLRRRLPEGPYWWLIFGLMSAAYGVVTLFRGDSMPLVGTFRVDTVLSAGLVVVSIVGCLLFIVAQSGNRLQLKGRDS
ncbi:MAG: prolipoprotein diacylglyceryl transferase family protein [Candidatus Promineifilaceae bacterium]